MKTVAIVNVKKLYFLSLKQKYFFVNIISISKELLIGKVSLKKSFTFNPNHIWVKHSKIVLGRGVGK